MCDDDLSARIIVSAMGTANFLKGPVQIEISIRSPPFLYSSGRNYYTDVINFFHFNFVILLISDEILTGIFHVHLHLWQITNYYVRLDVNELKHSVP